MYSYAKVKLVFHYPACGGALKIPLLNPEVCSQYNYGSLEEADLGVWPVMWKEEDREAVWRYAADCRQFGKKMLLFVEEDHYTKFPLDNVIVLRTHLFRSSKEIYEYAFPGWCRDLVATHLQGKLMLRGKTADLYPSIGFAGHVNSLEALYQQRLNAVLAVQQQPPLWANFVLRRHFHGDARLQEQERKRRELQFIENSLESDYSLVVRGHGNWSIRLGEILCLGKIPLFIDTDCVLPYDHVVDWKKYFLWVKESDLDRLGEIVYEYHSDISAEEYVERQKVLRGLWQEWFSPQGYCKNLWRTIVPWLQG